jgi:hypothetical protein
MTKSKSEPQLLGKNDAANGPGQYRTTPNLEDSQLFPGMKAVVPDETARNNGTRTGRNE